MGLAHGSRLEEVLEGEGLLGAHLRRDRLALAPHLSDDQLLVRVGRVVEPLPGGHQKGHSAVLGEPWHLVLEVTAAT